jgi:hypothetical protein
MHDSFGAAPGLTLKGLACMHIFVCCALLDACLVSVAGAAAWNSSIPAINQPPHRPAPAAAAAKLITLQP